MNTLIELYDERAIENILAPDMFRPRRIVYLCPGEIAQDRTRQETLAAFFRRRGWEPELIFVETSLFKADRILRQLFTIGERFPDCAIDVTGGSDAALFAAGMFAAKKGVPAFTYSRKFKSFYIFIYIIPFKSFIHFYIHIITTHINIAILINKMIFKTTMYQFSNISSW